jgi:hypothetical protein
MAAASSKIQKRGKQCLKCAEHFRHTGAVCVYVCEGTINLIDAGKKLLDLYIYIYMYMYIYIYMYVYIYSP